MKKLKQTLRASRTVSFRFRNVKSKIGFTDDTTTTLTTTTTFPSTRCTPTSETCPTGLM